MLHKPIVIKQATIASRIFALAFFVCVLLLSACQDGSIEVRDQVQDKLLRATVIKVKDGDSVVLRYANGVEKEARLFGIDAPEYNQAFGRDSRRILDKLVLKKSVLVKNFGEDRYQREIVLLSRAGEKESINLTMIRLGGAWVYAQYQKDSNWRNAEIEARNKRLGLWKVSRPLPPWEWRKK